MGVAGRSQGQGPPGPKPRRTASQLKLSSRLTPAGHNGGCAGVRPQNIQQAGPEASPAGPGRHTPSLSFLFDVFRSHPTGPRESSETLRPAPLDVRRTGRGARSSGHPARRAIAGACWASRRPKTDRQGGKIARKAEGGLAPPVERAISPCGGGSWTAFAVSCGRSCAGLSPSFSFPRNSPLILECQTRCPLGHAPRSKGTAPNSAGPDNIADPPHSVQGGPGGDRPPGGGRLPRENPAAAPAVSLPALPSPPIPGSPAGSGPAGRWDRTACGRSSSSRRRGCGG